MSGKTRQSVDTNSTEFTEGVEAGLNSEEDTKNWKAGNELGRALKEDGETAGPVYERPVHEPVTSLFMRDGREGQRGDAQDEKDATAE
jgi:hypothetical protein